MKLKYFFVLLAISCGSNISEEEYSKLKEQYEVCSKENEELKNTPENRFLIAQGNQSEGKLLIAESEYKELIEKYPKSSQAKAAKLALKNLEEEKERIKLEQERRNRLGFKSLKQQNSVELSNLKLTFSNIKASKRWIIDRYEDRYHYVDAERGNKYVTATLLIISKTKNPVLPPVYLYKIADDRLEMVSKMNYRFYRWKDYGSYLGNYADYGNDFAHSEKVRFSMGIDVSEEILKSNALFLLVGKQNCVERTPVLYGNPEVSYKYKNCNDKNSITLDQAEEDYYTIKKFNL
ncbi:hypothetical protein [Aquimarina celericrescens]|uniref:Tetratricopeptide repeat protein n=1 Tax=Aquimarina celericrescens TaxID=1964542 RepID=A0ABW5AUI2_9FLAO|nr:hypothetical protein [Aquimarina celericrescens]